MSAHTRRLDERRRSSWVKREIECTSMLGVYGAHTTYNLYWHYVRTGATIDASFELLKNTEIKNESVISLILKRKK